MKKKKKTSKTQASLFTGGEVLLIFLVTLLSKGLFAEGQVLPFTIVIGTVLILKILYKGITKSSGLSFSYVSIAFLLIAISFIPSFVHAESLEYTFTKVIEWTTYALVFLIIGKPHLKNISKVIVLFSIIFAVLHYFVLFGMIPIDGGVLLLGGGLSGSGIRLNGLLQYANATAAVIAALLLYSLQRFVVDAEGSKFSAVQYTSLLILSYLLLMTESRGAWLIFAICFMISLAIIEHTKQIQYIIHMSILMIFALITYTLTALYGLSLITACIILVSAIVFNMIANKVVGRIHSTPKSRSVIPVVLLVILPVIGFLIIKSGMLPTALQNRLTINLGSFSDRIVYMKDGFSAIQHNLFFGAGGEAWRFKMYQVQSAPYIAQDMHNFYLQHWLEVGLVGLALVTGLLLMVMVKIGKHQPLLIPPIAMLLVHALIDFTLSYGFVLLLLAIFIFEGLGENGFLGVGKWRLQPIITPIIAIVTLLCVVLSSLWVQGESVFSKGLQNKNPLFIDRAIEKNQYATRYKLARYPFASDQEKVLLMEESLVYEPHHALARFKLAQSKYEIGQYEEALIDFEQALKNDRFDRQKYEETITYLQSISIEDEQIRQKASALQEKIEGNLKYYEERADESPIRDQREFLIEK